MCTKIGCFDVREARRNSKMNADAINTNFTNFHRECAFKIPWLLKWANYMEGKIFKIYSRHGNVYHDYSIIFVVPFNISRVKSYDPTFLQYRTTIRISCFSKQRKSVLHKTEKLLPPFKARRKIFVFLRRMKMCASRDRIRAHIHKAY